MKITDLTKSDIGKTCFYVPSFGEPEQGIIKSWNDTYVFVVYPGNNDAKKEHWDRYTAAATKPEELYWKLSEKDCKCGHPLSEHFDPSYECGHDLEPDLAEGLSNYCRHCEEDSTWK